ncbi:MAG: DUF4962 domain-containing protein, partial [bacterium]|nr:DUF4962 domain-containing protein [bacterium]
MRTLAFLLLAALGPEFVLQNTPERGEPFEHSPLKVNPPTFRWVLVEGATGYELQLARSAELAGARRATAENTFWRPVEPLEPGRWWWRVRAMREGQTPRPWSSVETFVIGEELPRWRIPDWKQLLARVPKTHPRIYLRAEEIAEYRAKASGPLRAGVAQWAKRMERHLGKHWSVDDYAAEVPASGSGVDTREQEKKRRWAAKAAGGDLMGPVSDLCWLWVATGNEAFAAEARRRVLLAADLDPEGFLSHRNSDFGNAVVVANAALAYDMLFDRFSETERAAIRRMLVARATPIFENMRSASQRMVRAHAWQHVYLDGMAAALALYGEEPIARKWLDLGLRSFVALYPWFGGVDGGSQECANYYRGTNMVSSQRTRDVFLTAFGLDLAKGNPWYRGNPYFLLYAYPPGSRISPIGDLNPSRWADPPGDRERMVARRMADVLGNGYAADYADRIGGGALALNTDLFRWWPLGRTKSLSLESLPDARLFRDIGTLFLHSAYTRPEDNVRFEFRSSPYGGVGHGHSDQNSFHIIAYDEPLLIDSG